MFFRTGAVAPEAILNIGELPDLGPSGASNSSEF